MLTRYIFTFSTKEKPKWYSVLWWKDRKYFELLIVVVHFILIHNCLLWSCKLQRVWICDHTEYNSVLLVIAFQIAFVASSKVSDFLVFYSFPNFFLSHTVFVYEHWKLSIEYLHLCIYFWSLSYLSWNIKNFIFLKKTILYIQFAKNSHLQKHNFSILWQLFIAL